MTWKGEERRHLPLTEQQLDAIAEKVEKRLRDNLFKAVGKSVLTKLFYLVGAVVIGVWMWLSTKGHGP